MFSTHLLHGYSSHQIIEYCFESPKNAQITPNEYQFIPTLSNGNRLLYAKCGPNMTMWLGAGAADQTSQPAAFHPCAVWVKWLPVVISRTSRLSRFGASLRGGQWTVKGRASAETLFPSRQGALPLGFRAALAQTPWRPGTGDGRSLMSVSPRSLVWKLKEVR